MEYAAASQMGKAHSINQDGYRLERVDTDGYVAIVADGMGGHVAGEVASALAVATVWETLVAQKDQAPDERLLRAVQVANTAIYLRAQEDVAYAGMGTTVVAIIADESHLHVAHVGDSRAYLFHDGELTALTSDHSYVNELVRRGQLTPEAAHVHPQRNLLLRSLGTLPEVLVEYQTFEWQRGDLLLLCSDGLTNPLTDAQIAAIVSSDKDLSVRASELVQAAVLAGGRDDITAALLVNHEASQRRDMQ
ncbi:MAG: Stp1/IreP family PP2C-type Ser/Thr phosphatase [Firmicutes bacterium]|nr:Stp1/IreP family PP2C-type Ser/Thr phosphatase [Bacillota bacterium]